MRSFLVTLVIALTATQAYADTVPDVTGLTVQEAKTLLKQAGYEVEVSYERGRPADLVFAQEPPGFAARPAGTSIQLRAGKARTKTPVAPKPKTVPTFIGISAPAAREQMKAWPGAIEEESLVVPSLTGKVVHQWPRAGEPVPEGDHLVVVMGVNQRPTRRHKTVPTLEGETVPAARKAAKAAGFTLTVEEVKAETGAAALVLAQFPLAASLAESGTAVRVRVPRIQGEAPSAKKPAGVRPDPRLNAPALILPMPNDVARAPHMGFDWRTVPHADSYEVEVEREGDNGAWRRIFATLSTVPALRSIEISRGRFRWRVRARSKDAAGPWSHPRPFYVLN